jgi:hypothetical protein
MCRVEEHAEFTRKYFLITNFVIFLRKINNLLFHPIARIIPLNLLHIVERMPSALTDEVSAWFITVKWVFLSPTKYQENMKYLSVYSGK